LLILKEERFDDAAAVWFNSTVWVDQRKIRRDFEQSSVRSILRAEEDRARLRRTFVPSPTFAEQPTMTRVYYSAPSASKAIALKKIILFGPPHHSIRYGDDSFLAPFLLAKASSEEKIGNNLSPP
jgi:hypothetical protein